MMTIVPVFIMPLFNKYEPLPDGHLKRRIFELAASLRYPLTKLFVMDGSKRSSHSNAFMVRSGAPVLYCGRECHEMLLTQSPHSGFSMDWVATRELSFLTR